MANSVDPDQTAPEGACICHYVRHFGVRNFRTFTVPTPQVACTEGHKFHHATTPEYPDQSDVIRGIAAHLDTH